MSLPPDVKRFIALVLFLSVLCSLPLWTHPAGLAHPLVGIILLFFMYTPAAAALYLSFMNGEPNKRSLFALSFGLQWKRHWFLQWIGWPVLCFISLFLASLVGLYQFDSQFSGLSNWISDSINLAADQSGQPIIRLPLTTPQMAYSYLAMLLIAPLGVSAVSFGQEFAWRGWLLSKLLPLGGPRAIVVSNLVWGLWYAPIVALGYRYPEIPFVGVLLMLLFCQLVGSILSWSRLQTDSIWPAVIGHAAIITAQPIPFLFHHVDHLPHSLVVGLGGLTGCVLLAGFVTLLYKTNALHPPRPFIEQRR